MSPTKTRISVPNAKSIDALILAVDLRKNNWIYNVRLNKPVMVLGLDDLQISFEDSGGVIYANESIGSFIPIRITSYLLKRMKINNSELPNCRILKYEKKKVNVIDLQGNIVWSVDCPFLHTLQNIYYALNRRELNLLHAYFE